MLKIQEIREIIKLIDQSSIEKFSYEAEGTKIELKKSPVGHDVPAAMTPPMDQSTNLSATTVKVEQPIVQEAPEVVVKEEVKQDPSLYEVTSPMVGTFYAASSPDTDAFVQVGSKVTNESVVCIVEAMKLFNEIEAELSGEIVEILAKDGQLVEYGQPLFLVKAN